MITKDLLKVAELVKPENYVSIRELQKSPTKTLSSWPLKIILSNWKPIWIFFSIDKFEQLQEEMELLHDEKYLKDIQEARAETEFVPAEEVWAKAWLN